MSDSKALALLPFSEVQAMSDALAKSALLPDALKNKAVDLTFAILTGQELGLPPMQSIRGINIIQGKPVLSADTMVACVLGSGRCEYFLQVEASDTSVTFETKRKGAPVSTKTTWTIAMAKAAGLTLKDNWRAFPRAMLSARAKAELARLVYPDVLAGIYDPDEAANFNTPIPRASNDQKAFEARDERLNANIDAEDRKAIDADFVEVDPLPIATSSPTTSTSSVPPLKLEPLDPVSALIIDIKAAENEEQVRAFADAANKLPKGSAARAAVQDAYKTRLAQVKP